MSSARAAQVSGGPLTPFATTNTGAYTQDAGAVSRALADLDKLVAALNDLHTKDSHIGRIWGCPPRTSIYQGLAVRCVSRGIGVRTGGDGARHLQGLESLTSKRPIAPEITKSL